MYRFIYSLIFALVLGCISAAAQTADAGTPNASAQPLPTDTVQTDSAAVQPAAVELPEAPVEGVAPAVLWDRANTAYINGDYHRAIEVYKQILAQGLSSAKIYYNLGNAYFKEGNVGKAILFYNRALRLTPGNEDVRYNLEVAQSRAKDNIEQIPEFFAVTWLRALRHTMGCMSWSILSLVFLSLMLGLLLMYLLSQRLLLRKAGFYGTVAALLLCVVTTWFALLERQEMLREDEAIVMVSSSAVKSSPGNSATDLFLLHEGTMVTITDRLEGWAEVTIADGKKGWIELRKIEVI